MLINQKAPLAFKGALGYLGFLGILEGERVKVVGLSTVSSPPIVPQVLIHLVLVLAVAVYLLAPLAQRYLPTFFHLFSTGCARTEKAFHLGSSLCMVYTHKPKTEAGV
jgi:hypothetical protein